MAYESQYNLRVLINDLVEMGAWDLFVAYGERMGKQTVWLD